jgi:hypothetical protein
MITREPTIERLAVAERLLLTPFDLGEGTIAQALATIAAHRVDDADLYFQTTRHESWSLEEGIVKAGSFSIDRGVGVRAVSGERQAYAYSDDISAAALDEAAAAVRAIGRQGQSACAPVGATVARGPLPRVLACPPVLPLRVRGVAASASSTVGCTSVRAGLPGLGAWKCGAARRGTLATRLADSASTESTSASTPVSTRRLGLGRRDSSLSCGCPG